MDYKSYLKSIDVEIGKLQKVRAAILAYEQDEAPAPKVKTVKARKKLAKNGSNLLLQWLAHQTEPKDTRTIPEGVKAIGWQTTSDNPLNLLAVSLHALSRKGYVERIGTEWQATEAGKVTLVASPEVGA